MGNLSAILLPKRTLSIFRILHPKVTGFAGLFVTTIIEKVGLSVFGRHGPEVKFLGPGRRRPYASLRGIIPAKTKTQMGASPETDWLTCNEQELLDDAVSGGRQSEPGGLLLLCLGAHAILTTMMQYDIDFMQEALDEARAAAAAGEVPIGAVLVHDGKTIARSGNRTIRDCDPTAHAEIIVLREGARVLGNYRLAGATLYVTIEPCSMCAGAMIQARIPRLVYGTDDPKGGAARSCFQILSDRRLNHQVEVTSGVLADECAAVVQSFFAERR